MNVEQIVSELSKATEAELAEALTQIQTEGSTLQAAPVTEENVAALEKLAAAKTAIVGEQDRRVGLAQRQAAAKAAFTAEDPDNSQGAPQPKDGESPNANTEDPAETPAEDSEGAEGASGTESGEGGSGSVQASAKLGSIGKKATASVVKFGGQVAARTVGVTGDHVGEQISKQVLAEELAARFGQLERTGIEGRHTVARMEFSYPETRRLSTDSLTENMAKINAVTEPEALTAAGGFCAPLENLYDINVVGVTDRPVRDALARFQVSRGGIQYRPPMDALAMTNGQGIWTATNDAAVTDPPGASPVKTCAIIDCPALATAVVDAIYLCLQFPNFTARFDPEYVRANTDAAFIAHARFAENNLISKLVNGSKRITQAKTVSATRDILVALDKSIAYYRNRHRLNNMVPLRFILPRWVLDLIRADLCRGMGSVFNLDALAVADSAIQKFFSNRGVNVTWHLDGLAAQDIAPSGAGPEDIPAQTYANVAAGSPIPPFIDKIDSVLYAEGDWLFLDGGTLDLGLVRDSSLNKINRYQTFVESWEGVAFNGIESLRPVIEVQPTGMAGGTLDLSALTD